MEKPATASIETGRIVCGDNVAFMAGLPDACCDLIYADPPFFTGKTKTQADGKHRFNDSWEGGLDSFLDFLRPRLEQMRRLLKPTGSLYLHLDWHAVHYTKVMLDEIFGGDHFCNEIIWSYRTGGHATRWFARKHDTVLFYARQAGRQKFHVQHDGRFRTDGMKYDEQGRPYKQTKAGRLYFHPEGPAMTDVWEIPFLSTVSLERTGYPTQKPEALLERIIKASSDSDDIVADFFCGSGTTLAVAQRLGRRWLGCDISPEAVDLARRRVTGDQPRPPFPETGG
ncbi:MAG: site-specific DNA-methyltransferase [Phycisphaerae bacterium]|nr:site-specific DNA-methyltransferase [Phycisphaerae bacterium]